MATVSLYSTQITNRDASPKVLTNSHILKGALMESVGTLETSAADDIGSVYALCTIPSNARVSDVLLTCDSLGTAGAADIGLYQTTANGGAVVDADFFASAQALTSALDKTSVLHESAVFGKEDVEKRVWEVLGLSADPKIDYDVCATVTTATISAGTVSLHVRYVI